MIEARKTVYLLLICFLTFGFSGCVQTSSMFLGNKPSSSMNVVPLQRSAPEAGTWQTYQVVVNYKYLQTTDTLEISGHANLSDSYQTNFASLTNLTIYMFFLDEGSRVLETIILAKAVTSSIDEVLAFSSKYPVPPGATEISFGYDGAAAGAMGRIGAGISYFSELPLSKK